MRVLLAEDQPKVRFALRVLLGRQPDTEIVGEAVDGEQLLALVGKAHADLVLLAWGLPGLLAAELLGALRQMDPCLAVIALSGRPEARQAALEAGVDAFVSKNDPPDQLLRAIEACCSVQGCRSDRWPTLRCQEG